MTAAATTHLEVVGELPEGQRRGLEERILDLLARGAVRTRGQLREALAVQNERLGVALESLEQAGRLGRTPAGWRLREGLIERAVPVPPQEMIGNGTVEPAPSRGVPRTRPNHARD